MSRFIRVLFLCLLFFFHARAWATSGETTQDMNLGTYVQTASGASGVLSYNSTTSNLNGLVVGSSSTKTAATIRITGSVSIFQWTDNVTLSDGGPVVLSGPASSGCTITVSNLTFSSKQLNLNIFSRTQNANVGATVTISGGFCAAGEYSGTGTINVNGNSDFNQTFNITINLEAPLDIESTQEMDFGTIASPNMNSTVTLNPDGTHTQSGDIRFTDETLIPGEFLVTGVGGRLVNIGLPESATISNGQQTMTLDNFTSDPSQNFTLSGTGTSQTQTIKVGARLHVNKNQAIGTYTGPYTVTVTY